MTESSSVSDGKTWRGGSRKVDPQRGKDKRHDTEIWGRLGKGWTEHGSRLVTVMVTSLTDMRHTWPTSVVTREVAGFSLKLET